MGNTHTPGPWIVFKGASWHIWPNVGRLNKDNVIADVRFTRDGEGEANARLFLAAPDLAHALTVDDIDQIIDGIDNFCIGPVETPELVAIWLPYIEKLRALRAAITKALVPDPHKSALPCGCDPVAQWTCEQHRS